MHLLNVVVLDAINGQVVPAPFQAIMRRLYANTRNPDEQEILFDSPQGEL